MYYKELDSLLKIHITSGYQGKGEGQQRGGEVGGKNYSVKDTLQRRIIQHRQYSRYFVMTVNGLQL